ncbi:hypothetical protein TIFTF001_043986 [Ficus carica]|uniref:PNPLA domain-containing protein n=1 Tax=Ficus carica TaxID=3494 RepID=A0AA87Z0U4_FICCA|nr:hypothetical protein TIFTF001_043986 [Ficus carica]
MIFSTNKAKENALTNARLVDICLSTSAASTYLPAHSFVTSDGKGKARTFDLIDGAVAANNPTMLAISHIYREIAKKNSEAGDMEPMMSGKRMLVLSLGTRAAKYEEKYNAAKASEWGLLGWSPHHLKNYLRIQADTLTGNEASVDITTAEDLQRLVEIGKNLLEKPVSRVNLETGRFETIEGEGTNAEALTQFAKLLSQERKLRTTTR